MGVTRSEAEAHAIHMRYRRLLVAWARHLGALHAQQHGTVHSRIVRDLMDQRGWLREDVGETWLGSVFAVGCFQWTGEWIRYADARTNCHSKHIKLWKCTAVPPAPLDEPLSAFPPEPKPPAQPAAKRQLGLF